jgi:hypothetical protein
MICHVFSSVGTPRVPFRRQVAVLSMHGPIAKTSLCASAGRVVGAGSAPLFQN